LSFAPPICRMPLGQASGFPRAVPGGRVNPRFWHRLIRFRHFIDGSLALASLNLACRDLVPAFPQRSPPSLLTTAACGGLRPEPDCRPRRALLHLLYSYAPPFGRAMLVTHDPERTLSGFLACGLSPHTTRVFCYDRLFAAADQNDPAGFQRARDARCATGATATSRSRFRSAIVTATAVVRANSSRTRRCPFRRLSKIQKNPNRYIYMSEICSTIPKYFLRFSR
jgi:hypothetical protein